MNTHSEEQLLATQELKARLNLIETMIAEGRQKTESWGWTFVLWGAAYALAIICGNLGFPISEWTTWGHRQTAWPIAVAGALLVMFLLLWLRSGKSEAAPDTTMGRAISSIWIALGISMFLLLLGAGSSGRLDQHLFVAIISALLGMTNAASSMILKWRIQFLCALVWWATAVAACFGSNGQVTILFLSAIFLCQIVFGTYGMLSESQERKTQRSAGAAHA
jgi:hypothetical protein